MSHGYGLVVYKTGVQNAPEKDDIILKYDKFRSFRVEG